MIAAKARTLCCMPVDFWVSFYLVTGYFGPLLAVPSQDPNNALCQPGPSDDCDDDADVVMAQVRMMQGSWKLET